MSRPDPSPSHPSDVTVVVVTWQGVDLIADCLGSLREQDHRHQVLVVDNASTDGTVEAIRRDFPDVRVDVLERNTGFAGGVAHALSIIDTRYVALLNADARADRSWLSESIAMLDRDASLAGVSARMVLEDDHDVINNAGVRLTDTAYGADRGLGQRDDTAFDTPVQVFGASGGGCVLRTLAVKAVGGFDPSFFMYYEDTDLAWRLRLAGWSIAYCPTARVIHRHGASSGLHSRDFVRNNERNRLATLIKNAPAPVAAAWLARFARTTLGLRLRGNPDPDHLAHDPGLRLEVLRDVLRSVPALRRGRVRVPAGRRRQVLSDWLGVAERPLGDTAGSRQTPHRRARIFIDGEVLVSPHFSGIGHYTQEIVRAIDGLLDDRDDVTVELGVPRDEVDRVRRYGLRNITLRPHRISHRTAMIAKIRRVQWFYDLMFGRAAYLFPNFTSWPLLRSPAVTVVHDLSFEVCPQYVDPDNGRFLSRHVRAAIARGDRLVAVSRNGQREISEFYDVPVDEIAVVHNGVDRREFTRQSAEAIDAAQRRYDVPGPYVMFIGNIEPRKNLTTLLRAYEQLSPDLTARHALLLVGAKGWLDEEINESIERLMAAGLRVQQPSAYVEDEDRAALLSGASLFVYPSRYEGFGIPPLEAMACGVPVVTSDNSSLPEVVGDAALMVDAESVEDLRDAMSRVLTDDALRDRLVAEGYRQIEKYSWPREAGKMLDLLRDELLARGRMPRLRRRRRARRS